MASANPVYTRMHHHHRPDGHSARAAAYYADTTDVVDRISATCGVALKATLVNYHMMVATNGSMSAHRPLDVPEDVGEIDDAVIHNLIDKLHAFEPAIISTLRRHANRNAVGNFHVGIGVNVVFGGLPLVYMLLRFAYLCTQKKKKMERRVRVFEALIKALKKMPDSTNTFSNPVYNTPCPSP